jgi:hypothetical protein
MGLGPWSLVALLAALASTFDHPEPASSEPLSEASIATETSGAMDLSAEVSQHGLARAFAASFDTTDISRIGSLKVQQRCIRTTMDEDAFENLGWPARARPFRKALDDAELSAPPDPPRYLRLTLD